MTRDDIIKKMADAGLKAPAKGEFIFIHWDQIALLLEHERKEERSRIMANLSCRYSHEVKALACYAKGPHDAYSFHAQRIDGMIAMMDAVSAGVKQ